MMLPGKDMFMPDGSAVGPGEVKVLVVSDPGHIADSPFVTAIWQVCLPKLMVLLGDH